MSVSSAPAAPGGRVIARRGSRIRTGRERPPAGASPTAGYFFVALYVVLLVLLGIAPVVYAVDLALTNSAA